MLYNTHLFFSKVIYLNLLYKNGVRVRKFSFNYGSIKPDLIMNFKKIPHNYISSVDYIIDEINNLIEDTSTRKELRKKEFAVRLGIINHYVADFFCMPHNKNLVKKNFISHIIYEKEIGMICKKINVQKLLKFLNDNQIKISSEESVIAFIHSRYKSYEKHNFSPSNDIIYAIQTCAAVDNYIIQACLAKIKDIAA